MDTQMRLFRPSDDTPEDVVVSRVSTVPDWRNDETKARDMKAARMEFLRRLRR